MTKYKTGQIMKDKPDKKLGQFCCLHNKNLVPLEIGFASRTYPNGHSAPAYYNFAVSGINANVIRVKSYLCLDCKQEIKAPNPDTIKKDRL